MLPATPDMTDEELDAYIWRQDVKDAVKHKTTREEYITMHKPVYQEVAARAWDRFSSGNAIIKSSPVPKAPRTHSYCVSCGGKITRGESYCAPCDTRE